MERKTYLALYLDYGAGVTIGDDITVLIDKKKGRTRLLISAPKPLKIGKVFGTARRDQIQGSSPAKTKDHPKPLGGQGPTSSPPGDAGSSDLLQREVLRVGAEGGKEPGDGAPGV